jgi:hypothetical protein
MKSLSTQEANGYLSRIGMRIGAWNEIADIDSSQSSESGWINFAAPEKSRELVVFAQHAAGWLPKGEWKILQIDNSTALDAVESALVTRLIFGSDDVQSLDDNRTFLFEFGKSQDDDNKLELLIAHLVFTFLLFNCHVHFVSSGSDSGERLAIQDGYAYFVSRDKDIRGAKALLENFEKQPSHFPQWSVEIIAADQEKSLRGTDLG